MADFVSNKKPILLLGVGNILQKDDGIGVNVVNEMAEQELDEQVEVVDGGIAGIDLLSIIEGRKTLIVLDAVKGDQKPGTIYRFSPEDVAESMVPIDSLHQLGLLETLLMVRLIGKEPEKTVIFGVQPKLIDWGFEISDEVTASIPKLITKVKEEIKLALEDLEKSEPAANENGG